MFASLLNLSSDRCPFLPRAQKHICRAIAAAISPSLILRKTNYQRQKRQIRLVGVIEVPNTVAVKDLCKMTSVQLDNAEYLLAISHLGEIANIAWRKCASIDKI